MGLIERTAYEAIEKRAKFSLKVTESTVVQALDYPTHSLYRTFLGLFIKPLFEAQEKALVLHGGRLLFKPCRLRRSHAANYEGGVSFPVRLWDSTPRLLGLQAIAR
jgi:hypothetical protein